MLFRGAGGRGAFKNKRWKVHHITVWPKPFITALSCLYMQTNRQMTSVEQLSRPRRIDKAQWIPGHVREMSRKGLMFFFRKKSKQILMNVWDLPKCVAGNVQDMSGRFHEKSIEFQKMSRKVMRNLQDTSWSFIVLTCFTISYSFFVFFVLHRFSYLSFLCMRVMSSPSLHGFGIRGPLVVVHRVPAQVCPLTFSAPAAGLLCLKFLLFRLVLQGGKFWSNRLGNMLECS